jgi:23S rRNA pseudouridine1911/1915/1917 synthase
VKTTTEEVLRFDVEPGSAGERVDSWLAKQDGAPTRSQISQAADAGFLRVEGKVVKPSYRLRGGELVEFEPPKTVGTEHVVPQSIDIEVLYEDDAIVAVNKAPGMVVHPAAGNRDGTLVNAILHRYATTDWPGETERAGIVHRLDRDTSGVILVARTVAAHEALAKQFRERDIQKHYLALVRGKVPGPGRIEEAIGRHPRDRKRMSTASRKSRSAVTEYEPTESFEGATLLLVRPHTGRTHQIRVHLSSKGWPIVGDKVYGARANSRTSGRRRDALTEMPRQALHAWRIGFAHPISGEPMTVEAPLARDFLQVLERLRNA